MMLIHAHVLLGEITLSPKHYIHKRPEHPHRLKPTTCDIDTRQIIMLWLWMRGFPIDATGSPFCQACGMHTAHYVCLSLLFFPANSCETTEFRLIMSIQPFLVQNNNNNNFQPREVGVGTLW